jgi:hypothetical protein
MGPILQQKLNAMQSCSRQQQKFKRENYKRMKSDIPLRKLSSSKMVHSNCSSSEDDHMDFSKNVKASVYHFHPITLEDLLGLESMCSLHSGCDIPRGISHGPLSLETHSVDD